MEWMCRKKKQRHVSIQIRRDLRIWMRAAALGSIADQ